MRTNLIFLLLIAGIMISGCSTEENRVPAFSRIDTSTDCGVAPLTVQFNAYATGGNLLDSPTGGNTYLNIDWNFQDGNTGHGSVVSHIFTDPGTYIVGVTVTDADGDGETWYREITVLSDVMTVHAFPSTSITVSWTEITEPSPSYPEIISSDNGTYPTGSLVINEIMVHNTAAFADPDHPALFPSWIELYNGTAADINIGNWYLSNDISFPRRFTFPANTIIQANGFLMIMADNRTNPSGDVLHANFELLPDEGWIDENPEWDGRSEVVLTNSDREIIDARRFTPTAEDVSYGRYPDGSANATVQFGLDVEMCGIEPGSDYDRFECTWEMPSRIYDNARSPLHTFDFYDAGIDTVTVSVYDYQETITRTDTVIIEVLIP